MLVLRLKKPQTNNTIDSFLLTTRLFILQYMDTHIHRDPLHTHTSDFHNFMCNYETDIHLRNANAEILNPAPC